MTLRAITALWMALSVACGSDRIAPDEIIAERDQLVPRAIVWLQTGR